ncbi:hypothetical protein R3W88_026898 [Solanum pinnatisectum]|uniref:Uncharacterized protein n=1 Tax=Solanum pinnatisectum TaxID=50273 RepID=A0AAV9LEM7_9SOLN|nr:hypothetical protein R3W88_026898 [Solanum pinnatisectum]
MQCQYDLVRSTTGNSVIASYFIPSIFEGVTLMCDSSSLQWCLSFNAFHALPTIKFGENQVMTIADKSLVFTLEFDEAFNLIFSIFIAYNRSALAYHCIPNNTFTELFVVAYARVHVELNRNLLNPNGQVPLLDTLDNHVFENIASACCVTL